MYRENKNAINFGLTLGVIGVLIQTMVYYLAPQLLGEFSFGIISMLISLALYILFIFRFYR